MAHEQTRSPGARQTGWGTAIGTLVALIAIGTTYILMSRSKSDGVAQVSLDSLQVTQLTSSGNAFLPAVSPDGKYVVYLQGEANGASLWLRQVAATSSVKLVPADGGASPGAATIGPDSTFVDYMRDGGIWRVPFLGGTSKLVVEHASTPVGWAPDGQHMAFVRPARAEGPGLDLVVADRDGRGERSVAASGAGSSAAAAFAINMPGGTVYAPAWSPDGRRIAMFQRLGEDVRDIGIRVFDVEGGASQVVKTRGDVPLGLGWFDAATLIIAQALETGTPSQLWRISFPGGERSKLSNDVNRYSDVRLTADASELVTSRPEMRVEIWVGDAKGAGREVIRAAPFLSSAFYYATVDWDDQRLLLSHTLNGRYEIFGVNPDGANSPEAIVAGREFSVADDGTIVFRAVADQDGLWKVGRDGQRPVELAKGSVSYPFISRDGQRVVFSSRMSGPQTLWQVLTTGGPPTQMLDMPVGINSFSDISPDGRSIVFAYEGKWTVCDFPACTVRKAITPVRGTKPRWMADGRAFSYIDTFGSGGNIWVQPLDGSAPVQLTHFTDGKLLGHFAWSRDGKRLAISRSTPASDIVLFRGLKGK